MRSGGLDWLAWKEDGKKLFERSGLWSDPRVSGTKYLEVLNLEQSIINALINTNSGCQFCH